MAFRLAKGKFTHLTCSIAGEERLEHLVASSSSSDVNDENVVCGAIVALQSLLITGMQVGLKGSPEQQQRFFRHLSPSSSDDGRRRRPKTLRESMMEWSPPDDVKRLKHERDGTAAIELLAYLKRKRSAQGAFDLLVSLGVWKRHEDMALLRSGFPVRFSEEEELAAQEMEESSHDPDEILGIREDLRRLKIYTIDGASTSEIDDGLSVEVLSSDDEEGDTRQRFWIHIADADRWVPRGSRILEAAKRRMTSIYLPTGGVHMLPSRLSVNLMSLNANKDTQALSLGVELLPSGAIDTNAPLIVTPSLVRVSYRLTYNEVDEMLEEGVGYDEEWQLGALLTAAIKRRLFRSRNGSSEAMIPHPVPQGSVFVEEDESAEDGVRIGLNVDVSHNAGVNNTVSSSGGAGKGSELDYAAPVSPANLLVTEMMILAGEAIGKWGAICKEQDRAVNGDCVVPYQLDLPYRSQKKPAFETNERGAMTFEHLKQTNKGYGYCAAWYVRRFFSPVKVTLSSAPHAGMGLDCYVQWTSPIRRFGDLQVHAMVKRYLRRKRINELLTNNQTIPEGITSIDIGYPLPNLSPHPTNTNDEDSYEIDFNEGIGLFRAARPLMRSSQLYWQFEYVRRLISKSPDVAWECTVLGCVDTARNQYTVYIHELGLEHRYLSEMGRLEEGMTLWLAVRSVQPRMGLMTLTLAPERAVEESKVAGNRKRKAGERDDQ